jgi:hypothetical protein
VRWPTPVTSADPLFIAQACNWMRRPAAVLLRMIWSAYDAMLFDRPFIDGRDLERSITQLLEPRIRNSMSGDEPFYIQHGPFERETMAKPPAQPPAYDLAFVLRADERVMWPLEAKVLETPNQLASYHRDIQQEFLTCRYAPFSMSGAMLGYLLSGTAEDALNDGDRGQAGLRAGNSCRVSHAPDACITSRALGPHRQGLSRHLRLFPPNS